VTLVGVHFAHREFSVLVTCEPDNSVVHRRFEQAGLAFVEGEPDAKGRAAADLAFELDAATMGADYPLHNH
jgi:hypothetical protein